MPSLVGSEMCIRDRYIVVAHIPISLLNFEGVACRIFLPLAQTHQNPGGKAIYFFMRKASKFLEKYFRKHSNIPEKQLRLRTSTRPPGASLWRHVPATQQPFSVPGAKQVPCPTRRAGSVERRPPGDGSARSPGWRRIVKTWKSHCHSNSVCVDASAAVLRCIGVCLLYTSPSPRD